MSNSSKPPHSSFFKTLLSNLLDFNKSETLKITNEKINKGHEILDKLHEQHHIDPMTIDDFLHKLSPIVDEKIIEEMAKNSSLKPIKGEFKLSIEHGSNNVLTEWDFYFIDNHQQYKKIGSKKVFDKDFFTTDAYAQIQNTSPAFDIEAP